MIISIRRIQRRIKSRFIKKTAHRIKTGYFYCVDIFGSLIFFLGRFFKLIPQIKIYSKSKVNKILVVRTDRIGDVILSTPTLKALRENFPESFITFLTTPYTMDLVSENKDISEVIIYDWHWSVFEKVEFIKRLKNYKFDLAIILSPFFEAAFIAFLSGAPFRIGYPLNGSGFLLTTKIDLKNRCKHEIETCLDVVRAIDVDTQDKRPRLPIKPEAERYAEVFFTKHKILSSDLVVGVHPGGYEEHTRWNEEGFVGVADALISQYRAKVIFLGDSSDRKIINSIRREIYQEIIVVEEDISLQQLAAIIKKSNIFLGNVSGPMHIATAVGTPVVAIFGNIHPLDSENKWAPYGDGHIIVRKNMDCIDCYPGHCRDYKCMKMITPEDVLEAIRKQIKKLIKDEGNI